LPDRWIGGVRWKSRRESRWWRTASSRMRAERRPTVGLVRDSPGRRHRTSSGGRGAESGPSGTMLPLRTLDPRSRRNSGWNPIGAGRPEAGEEGGAVVVPVGVGTGGGGGDLVPAGAAAGVGMGAVFGFFRLCRGPLGRLRRLAPLCSRSNDAGTIEVGRGREVPGGSGRLTTGGMRGGRVGGADWWTTGGGRSSVRRVKWLGVEWADLCLSRSCGRRIFRTPRGVSQNPKDLCLAFFAMSRRG